MQSIYVCPRTKNPLQEHDTGLLRDDGVFYPFLKASTHVRIPNFLVAQEHSEAVQQSLSTYDQKASIEIYSNFLDWLFQTFHVSAPSFRTHLIGKLKLHRGNRVLITGCGLGDDIRPVIDAIGPDGEIYANDLAVEMAVATSHYVISDQPSSNNIFLSVCDAQLLPFSDDFFDGAFHFGGMNLFDNIKLSIGEMERVVKPGGRVVFGDEGVGPWLRNTQYGRVAINNNSTWAATAPIDLLPRNSLNVHLSWVLGNCFYVIDFEVSDIGPFMNIDVRHKGRRGGSMRTRYFGQLEGVTEESKKFVLEDAERKDISVHSWLEQVIRDTQER